MKNHWLDKKADKELDLEIDKACEQAFTKAEFKDTDFIDLSNVTQHKEYDRLVASEKSFLDELDKCNKKEYDILTSTDAQDREMMKAIILKNIHKTHWMEEVLAEVQYVPHLAPGCDPTISEFSITTSDLLGNISITCGTGVMPGGDGITLNDASYSGFPQDDANSLQQGSAGDANLDIWYGTPFAQNEKLRVLDDVYIDVTLYQTMYTPVLAGTMTGTIYPTPGNTSYGFTFVVSADGKFHFDKFVRDDDGNVEYASKQPKLSDEEWLQALADGEYDDRFMCWYEEIYAEKTTLNLKAGVLELHHRMGQRPEIIVSYEYTLEGDK